MLIKEEKYIYVIKIKRLICVDNVITVGAHTLSSNPASVASPGSVNLSALIADVKGRVGNALPAAGPEALNHVSVLHLASLTHGSHSLRQSQPSTSQPWEHRSTCPPSSCRFRNFPFAPQRLQTQTQNLLRAFQSLSPKLPRLEISKMKSFSVLVQLSFSSLRNWTTTRSLVAKRLIYYIRNIWESFMYYSCPFICDFFLSCSRAQEET